MRFQVDATVTISRDTGQTSIQTPSLYVEAASATEAATKAIDAFTVLSDPTVKWFLFGGIWNEEQGIYATYSSHSHHYEEIDL